MTAEAIARRWLDGWSAHDADQLAALLDQAATYTDPTTRVPVHPWDLESIIEAMTAQFSNFGFAATRITPAQQHVVIEWRLSGTNDGSFRAGIQPTGRTLHLSGTDVLEFEGGLINRAVRHYDRREMAEQIGLQVLTEPFSQGASSYGYSLHASSGNPARPGIIALTWIAGRNEAERDAIRTHSGQIIGDFLRAPGFIGIVTGFAGTRGFTCTAWENEEALYDALNQHHAHAKQAFRTSGLAPAVWTSVWKPHHINRLWVRCTVCDLPHDSSVDPYACSACGGELPPRPVYW